MVQPWSPTRWVLVGLVMLLVGVALAFALDYVAENRGALEQGRARDVAIARDVRQLRSALGEANERLEAAGRRPVPLPTLPPPPPAAPPEGDDPERQEPEHQQPERQQPERQQVERQDREIQQREQQDPDANDLETQDEERQDAEVDEPEEQEAEVQDEEIQDPEEQEPEQQEPEEQEAEAQDPEPDDPEPNDPQDPPATLTFNFGPPFGTFACTRDPGSPPENPTYSCEQEQP